MNLNQSPTQTSTETVTPEVKVETKPAELGLLANLRKAREESDSQSTKPQEKADPSPQGEEIDMSDVPQGTSSAVSGKFKEYKSKLRDSEKRLSELQAEVEALKNAPEKAPPASVDPKTTEDYLKLVKERDALLERTEQLNLEESPRFKEKFDKKMDSTAQRMAVLVDGIQDREDSTKLGGLLMKALSVPVGDVHENQFYTVLDEAFDEVTVSKTMQAKIQKLAEQYREDLGERGKALSEWQKTKGSLDSEVGTQLEGYTKEAITHFQTEVSLNESQNQDLLRAFRDKEDIIGYDAKVKPMLQQAAKEIEISQRSSKITPGLVRLAQQGAQLPFYKEQFVNAMEFMKERDDIISELRGKLKDQTAASPFSGAGNRSANSGSEKPLGLVEKLKGAMATA